MVLVILISVSSYLLGQYAVDLMTRSFALQRSGSLNYKQYLEGDNDECVLLKKTDQPNFSIPNNYTI